MPIVILVAFSFNDSRLAARWVGFTTKWYVDMVQSEAVMIAMENSLIVAFISTIIATRSGTMTALAMERFRFPFRSTYDGVIYLPVIIPDIVMGISLLAFFSLFLGGMNGLSGVGGQRTPRARTDNSDHRPRASNISYVAIVVRTSRGS